MLIFVHWNKTNPSVDVRTIPFYEKLNFRIIINTLDSRGES